MEALIRTFDRSLRVLATPARASRPYPAEAETETRASPTDQRLSAGLMRVNHTGEVCAQALYQGQALFARSKDTRGMLLQAAEEEWDHLGWCQRRLTELDSRPSLLNPLWYAGSLALGMASALAGDRWNMAFLVETERQVEHHLDSHLNRLPAQDARSRAIVAAMAGEEAAHANAAESRGAATLPAPVRLVMRGTARLMTAGAFWI